MQDYIALVPFCPGLSFNLAIVMLAVAATNVFLLRDATISRSIYSNQLVFTQILDSPAILVRLPSVHAYNRPHKGTSGSRQNGCEC